MEYPIRKIEGIGRVNEAKLGKAGIETTGDLLESCRTPVDREKVAAETGIGTGSLLSWARRADLMRIPGVAGEYSELLEEAGVVSVRELARRDAGELRAATVRVNEERRLVRQPPSVEEVSEWVRFAKSQVPEGCAETWFRKLESFVRNNYFLGKLMTARDMKAEQEYVRRNFALGRRTIAGSGIVCGLGVRDVSLDDLTLTVEVEPGLAVDPFGRFIVVGPPKKPEEAAETLPECEPPKGPEHSVDVSAYADKFEGAEPFSLYLYIYYDEDEYERVPTFKRDEPCEEDLMPNRVREIYGFTVSDTRLKWIEPVWDEKEVVELEHELRSERPQPVPRHVETRCPEPTHKCVFLAELKGKKERGVWEFRFENAERAIYSNVELYELIMKYLGVCEGVVKNINEAVPDDGGKIALSGGAGIGITKVGDNKLSVSLAGAGKYVKSIEVVGGDAAEAVGNKVRFKGKNGIKIKTFATDGVKNGLTFALDGEAVGGEYKITAGEMAVALSSPRRDAPHTGKKAKKIRGVKLEDIAAVNLAYSCPDDRENPARKYLGESELLYGTEKVHLQLAGWVDRVLDRQGNVEGVKLQVYVKSESSIKNASVHYAIIEQVER
jgi:predicted flap endonuclease-1-like 5' DNA nuclease